MTMVEALESVNYWHPGAGRSRWLWQPETSVVRGRPAARLLARSLDDTRK